MLHFYASKASRHLLDRGIYKKIVINIDKLYKSDFEIPQENAEERSYIFCPEHDSDPIEIYSDGRTRIFVFGSQEIPGAPTPQKFSFGAGTPINSSRQPDDVSTPPNKFKNKESIKTEQKYIEKQKKSPEQKFNDEVSESQNEIYLLLGQKKLSDESIEWKISISGNPHLMIVGQPGMGKTTCLINLCEQLFKNGITPIVFSYHSDIDTRLQKKLKQLKYVDIESGIGFNPMRIVGSGVHAWVDNVGMLRDIFSSIYTDFGEIQTNEIREAIKKSYTEIGYGDSGLSMANLPIPEFQRFYDILKEKPKPNKGIMFRLEELNDYGLFRQVGEEASLLKVQTPTLIRVHVNQNEVIQKAISSFVLFNIYQNMFMRGEQSTLTHAVIFDEAHRASRLKLLPTMAKECRKYGISLIVASQAAKDFNQSLYSAIANYLVLRVIEADANALAKNVVQSREINRIAGKLKLLEKYNAIWFSEGMYPTHLKLYNPE